jgi:hypothetical protein
MVKGAPELKALVAALVHAQQGAAEARRAAPAVGRERRDARDDAAGAEVKMGEALERCVGCGGGGLGERHAEDLGDAGVGRAVGDQGGAGAGLEGEDVKVCATVSGGCGRSWGCKGDGPRAASSYLARPSKMRCGTGSRLRALIWGAGEEKAWAV